MTADVKGLLIAIAVIAAFAFPPILGFYLMALTLLPFVFLARWVGRRHRADKARQQARQVATEIFKEEEQAWEAAMERLGQVSALHKQHHVQDKGKIWTRDDERKEGEWMKKEKANLAWKRDHGQPNHYPMPLPKEKQDRFLLVSEEYKKLSGRAFTRLKFDRYEEKSAAQEA